MELFSLAITLFLIANPIGNVPAIVGLIKDFPFERQKKIMLRECILALAVALLFQFVGDKFLRLIQIREYTVSISGGVLLFIVSLEQIFPSHMPIQTKALQKEPFLVPIATPLITGGGLMSTIMLYSSLVGSPLFVSTALLLSWVLVTPVMLGAPYIQKVLGRRGILALEQFMGMVLALLSMELIVNGIKIFIEQV